MPNYDNDPQIKELMDNFNKQTQQRLREYDERMEEKRQKCKEQCDQEIQQIILKDKIEKNLTEKLAVLQTDIRSDAIPTCVCEKSVADKVENFCLNCGMNVGGAVTLSSGVLGGIGSLAVHAWKPLALKSAIAAALKANDAMISTAANAAGMKAGKIAVIGSLKELGVEYFWPEMSSSILKMGHYNEVANLTGVIYGKKFQACVAMTIENFEAICEPFDMKWGILKADGVTNGIVPGVAVAQKLKGIVAEATEAANIKAAEVTTSKTLAIKEAQEKAIEAASTHLYTTIAYSILAILIIVLIMVIIYLILRYRRKKKMKKKLQYIKLLEE
ncbi:hypothetical protein PFFCH_05576 [Plasmodium falciparum FCH/4]|uniref:Surface antigen n=1 Tax=Plasmodium falciparum FCH/4 TaxID=1036724 RepID=A0A024VFP1_PLAFA|nr:hypothetical protein PFFCH_05576 [Plasmodium falciparum FCH/4]